MIKRICFCLMLTLFWVSAVSQANDLQRLFAKESLTSKDSVLVMRAGSQTPLYSWQADKPLIPASLAKLATSWWAIETWGMDKEFVTDFYRSGETLWVKGYGDPFLVSEELDLIATALKNELATKELDFRWVSEIAIDNTYFKEQPVPGRSKVADPYNAPLSALAVNFNTAQLANNGGRFVSTESQTPLTQTAVRAAKVLGRPASGKRERVNLIDVENASSNAAELFVAKLKLPKSTKKNVGPIPQSAQLLYRHTNSRRLPDVIRGMLEYSNNFMANQVFLMLVNKEQASFAEAAHSFRKVAEPQLGWSNFVISEGAGLARQNRLSSTQINQLLVKLSPHKALLKRYEVADADVYAKTGTLNNVRSFAGYILIDDAEYRFVFNFNRAVPFRYRESLLEELVIRLKAGHHS